MHKTKPPELIGRSPASPSRYPLGHLRDCDAKGDTHDLLCQTDVITEKAKRVWLAMEDLEYLERQNTVLSNGHRSVNPQTLLG